LKYEDLVANTDEVLQKIGHFIGEDLSKVIRMVQTNTGLAVGHNLGGNRMRFSNPVALSPDMEWEKRLALPYRILFIALCWPLMLKFKYKIRI
jgi:hypothetical protein